MLWSVELSEVFSLAAFEPLRRCSGGEGYRRPEPRFPNKSLGCGFGARYKFCLEARCAVGPTSTGPADLGELPGLLGLSWMVKRSATYKFQLEQGCFPTSQNCVYVQWFVCFAQNDLWVDELTSETSALILSVARFSRRRRPPNPKQATAYLGHRLYQSWLS